MTALFARPLFIPLSRRLVVAFIAVVAAVSAGTLSTTIPASAALTASDFVPLFPAPFRIMDTRDGTGVRAGLRAPGSSTDLTIAGWFPPGGGMGVALDATAVVLNVTITESVGAGYVQVFPTAMGTPGASSNLNVASRNVTIANLVIVPLGANGSVTFYTSGGGHLVADLVGYFVPTESRIEFAGGHTRFRALEAPLRVLDTRYPFRVPVNFPGDVVDCDDFATWNDANTWFWTHRYWDDPAGLDDDGDGVPCEALPGSPSEPVIPADLFKLGSGKSIRVPITDHAPPLGGPIPGGNAVAVVMNVTVVDAVAPFTPDRLIDTRDLGGPLPAQTLREVDVASLAEIDPNAMSAMFMNATIVDSLAAGYMQMFPTGKFITGESSTVNVTGPGQTRPNAAITAVHAGHASVYLRSGGHFILDAAGYFTSGAA